MFSRKKPEPPKRKARSGDLSQVFNSVFCVIIKTQYKKNQK